MLVIIQLAKKSIYNNDVLNIGQYISENNRLNVAIPIFCYAFSHSSSFVCIGDNYLR